MSTVWRTGRFGGAPIEYEARIEDLVVPDRTDKCGARYVYISYCRASGPDLGRRPVIFAFNGGPGSSSIWVHLGILGPRRVAHADDLRPRVAPPFALVDNADTPLDVADVVLIDPPGTGFSRVLGDVAESEFFSIRGDAVATIRFINQWCRVHHRENSPRFLLGESYGTVRAAAVAKMGTGGPTYTGSLDGISLNGVIVMGAALGQHLRSTDSGYAVALPSLAATAWYHDHLPGNRLDLTEHMKAASEFAASDYLTAVFAGTRMDKGKRQRVARRMHELLGISPQICLDHNLRIDVSTFAKQLLADEGKQVGLYDSRYALPLQSAGDDMVGDDPAMSQYTPGFVGTIGGYLRDELGAERTEEYRAIEFSRVHNRWEWGERNAHADSCATDFATAMQRNPRLELLVCAGIYDLLATAGAAEYSLAHTPLDQDRVHVRTYQSGHMPYLGMQSRQQLAADIRSFITRVGEAASPGTANGDSHQGRSQMGEGMTSVSHSAREAVPCRHTATQHRLVDV
jgi:carboxypeptidase C (cathepsin A)